MSFFLHYNLIKQPVCFFKWVSLLIVCCINFSFSEEYAGEIYLIGYNVPANGLGRTIPSTIYSPSQFVDFPAIPGNSDNSIEVAAIPQFGSLGSLFLGSVLFSLDSLSQIGLAAAMGIVDGIISNPAPNYTQEERYNDPDKRLQACPTCPQNRNADYLIFVNFQRSYNGELPRIDFTSRPIPICFTWGTTVKYFKEELEGQDYIAQNLNMDMGASLKLDWGYNPAINKSSRAFSLDLNGFELLQTSQASKYAREKIASRFYMGLYWQENLEKYRSKFTLGIRQKPGWGRLPGIGMEWNYANLLAVRAGAQTGFITGGIGFNYHIFNLHYSLSYHELSYTLNQISLQLNFH